MHLRCLAATVYGTHLSASPAYHASGTQATAPTTSPSLILFVIHVLLHCHRHQIGISVMISRLTCVLSTSSLSNHASPAAVRRLLAASSMSTFIFPWLVACCNLISSASDQWPERTSPPSVRMTDPMDKKKL